MSKISLEPNASGAGTFTLAAPNSNTNRTLNLPDESGILFSDGTGVPGSAVTGQLASSNMPAGSVIQVVSTTKASAATVSGNVEISDFSVEITPQSTNNKILVICTLSCSFDNQGSDNRRGGLQLLRNGANVGNDFSYGKYEQTVTDTMLTISFSFLDNPSTTSATTYSVFHNANANSMRILVNRTISSDSAIGISSITAMEIAG